MQLLNATDFVYFVYFAIMLVCKNLVVIIIIIIYILYICIFMLIIYDFFSINFDKNNSLFYVMLCYF